MTSVADTTTPAKTPTRAKRPAKAASATVAPQPPADEPQPQDGAPAPAQDPGAHTPTGADAPPAPERAPAAPRPNGFTDAQHKMLDAIHAPEDRAARALLFYAWERTGLDPFAGQIYLRMDMAKVRRQNDIGNWTQREEPKYSVGTYIAGFRVVAETQGTYEGQTVTQWCGRDGRWTDVWLGDASTPPVAARVGVYRRGYREPVWAVAKYAEYKRSDSEFSNWVKMAAHMVAKVAEALALRKAYPSQLSGIYTDDEIPRYATDGADIPAATGPADGPAAVFDMTAAAAECYATAKLVAADPDAVRDLYREAAHYPGGNLLGVYLTETSGPLAAALGALVAPAPQAPTAPAAPTPAADGRGDNERRQDHDDHEPHDDDPYGPGADDPWHIPGRAADRPRFDTPDEDPGACAVCTNPIDPRLPRSYVDDARVCNHCAREAVASNPEPF